MIFPLLFCFQKLPGRRLAQEEKGLDVDIHHIIPVFFRELDGVGATNDPGIIHEDVQFSEGVDGLPDHALNGLKTGEIGLDAQESPSQTFDAGLGFREIQAVDSDNVGPGFCKAIGHSLPQAGSTAP